MQPLPKTRDSQRAKVYSWENRLFWTHEELSFDECLALVSRVRIDYGAPMLRVLDGRARTSACYAPDRNAIVLPRQQRKTFVVLHELAHSLAGITVAWHGPEFMRIYLDLLERYLGKSMKDLRASCKVAHIKVARTEAVVRRLPRRSVGRVAEIDQRLAAIRLERRLLRDEETALLNERERVLAPAASPRAAA